MSELLSSKSDSQNKTVASEKVTEIKAVTNADRQQNSQNEHGSAEVLTKANEVVDKKTVIAGKGASGMPDKGASGLLKKAAPTPKDNGAATVAAAPLADAKLACQQKDPSPTDSVLGQELPDDIFVATTPDNSETETHKEQKYQVNVKHYASYDQNNNENIYSEGAKENIKYASKTLGGRFLGDLVCVMFRPKHFWEGQDAHPATLTEALFPHLAVLVVIRALASFIGGYMQSDNGLKALGQSFMHGVFIFIFVFALSLCYSAVVAFTGKSFDYNRALKFVCYAITPILVAGILSVIPVDHFAAICDLLAMPYAFYVMGHGVAPFLKIHEKSAPPITGLLCGIMMCLWGALPILLPYAISQLIE